jgi:DNA-binding response OmpR family regulator
MSGSRNYRVRQLLSHVTHKILIVEDEALLAMEISHALESAGHDVVGSAPSLAQAEKLVAQMHPDVVLLDINLGNERGETFARKLADNCIPFVFVTAHVRGDIDPQFSDRPYLQKPVHTDLLLAAIALAVAA